MSRADDNLAAMRRPDSGDWPDRLMQRMARMQPSDILTASELKTLAAMSYGMVMQEIAVTYGVHISTVRDHLMKARRKLRAKNTTHAVALAIRQGLIA
jgi:DNA-binding CsgD family transcriptional regulator